MNPGIYDGISNADYHGGEGVSKSMLDVIARSTPLHLHAKRIGATSSESTKAQFIGSEFHALLLEPAEFVKEYTLAFRQCDMPDAIDSRPTLVAMVEEINKGRLPRLSASGTKDELAARVAAAVQEHASKGLPSCDPIAPETAKIADLKAQIDQLNVHRPGSLPTTGSMADLAAILRANGKTLRLWDEVKAEWDANNGHRRILTQEQWQQIHAMRDAVMAHPAARSLLTNVPGKAEQSVYWIDPQTGVKCRCRPDYWRADNLLLDVKTTEDASPEAFSKSIGSWRYHVQHPMYLDGVNAAIQQGGRPDWITSDECRGFAFIVVEKSACVVNGKAKGVAVYVLEETDVDIGRAEYRAGLKTYAACLANDNWPGYSEGVEPISLPTYTRNKAAAILDAA